MSSINPNVGSPDGFSNFELDNFTALPDHTSVDLPVIPEHSIEQAIKDMPNIGSDSALHALGIQAKIQEQLNLQEMGNLTSASEAGPLADASLDAVRNGGRVLKNKSNGPDVVALQQALNAAGAQPPLEPDGSFGQATYAAVKAFQERTGCSVDGRVGPETMAALDRALGGGGPDRADVDKGGTTQPTTGGKELTPESRVTDDTSTTGGTTGGTTRPMETTTTQTTSTQPAGLSNAEEGIVRSAAVDIYNAIDGPGTWDNDLQDALQKIPSGLIGEVEKHYESKYGESLRKALVGDLSGDDLDTAMAQLNRGLSREDAQVHMGAHLLYKAMKGYTTSTEQGMMMGLLRNATPQQRAEAKQVFDKVYGGGQTLENWLYDDLSEGDYTEAIRLLNQR